MRDLDLVVEAHVLLEHGVAQRAAVDGGVGADLAVVADAHAAELRHLEPVVTIEGKAETVGAQHRTGMHQYAAAESHAFDQGHARHQSRLRTHRAVGSDHAVRAQLGAVLDPRTGRDHAQRTDAGPGADLRARRDHRAGMDARLRMRALFKQRGDAGEGHVGVGSEQRRYRAGAGILGTQHHGAGTCRRQLRGIAQVGQKRQLLRTGIGQAGDAGDRRRGVTAPLKTEA